MISEIDLVVVLFYCVLKSLDIGNPDGTLELLSA